MLKDVMFRILQLKCEKVSFIENQKGKTPGDDDVTGTWKYWEVLEFGETSLNLRKCGQNFTKVKGTNKKVRNFIVK